MRDVFDIDSVVGASGVWRIATSRGTLAQLGVWTKWSRVCVVDHTPCGCVEWEMVIWVLMNCRCGWC